MSLSSHDNKETDLDKMREIGGKVLVTGKEEKVNVGREGRMVLIN